MTRSWADWLTWLRTPPEGPAPWARPRVALRRARVALVSTAGVRLLDQRPFSPGGDVTYRAIPADTRPIDLVPDHPRYDTGPAAVDINCVFPLQRLWEFAREGLVGEVAPTHFGLMGYIPNPTSLRNVAAPELATTLQRAGVTAVVLTAGCYTSHRSAALIQRAIEAALIPTVLVAHHASIVARVRAPRALIVPFPEGQGLGPPGDRTTQRRVLYAALELLNAHPQGPGGVQVIYNTSNARRTRPVGHSGEGRG